MQDLLVKQIEYEDPGIQEDLLALYPNLDVIRALLQAKPFMAIGAYLESQIVGCVFFLKSNGTAIASGIECRLIEFLGVR